MVQKRFKKAVVNEGVTATYCYRCKRHPETIKARKEHETHKNSANIAP
jgi:hypothetical protein